MTSVTSCDDLPATPGIEVPGFESVGILADFCTMPGRADEPSSSQDTSAPRLTTVGAFMAGSETERAEVVAELVDLGFESGSPAELEWGCAADEEACLWSDELQAIVRVGTLDLSDRASTVYATYWSPAYLGIWAVLGADVVLLRYSTTEELPKTALAASDEFTRASLVTLCMEETAKVSVLETVVPEDALVIDRPTGPAWVVYVPGDPTAALCVLDGTRSDPRVYMYGGAEPTDRAGLQVWVDEEFPTYTG